LLVPKEGQLSDEQISYVLEGQQKRWGGFFDISAREVDSIPLTKGAKRRLVVCDINSSSSV
jgi:phenylacetate-CoA ligase